MIFLDYERCVFNFDKFYYLAKIGILGSPSKFLYIANVSQIHYEMTYIGHYTDFGEMVEVYL